MRFNHSDRIQLRCWKCNFPCCVPSNIVNSAFRCINCKYVGKMKYPSYLDRLEDFFNRKWRGYRINVKCRGCNGHGFIIYNREIINCSYCGKTGNVLAHMYPPIWYKILRYVGLSYTIERIYAYYRKKKEKKCQINLKKI